jgi:hypothetical protein
MAKTRRRGGASWVPSWVPYFGKKTCEAATKDSTKADEAAAKAKATKDESCAGEASATSLPSDTPVTDTAPATSTQPTQGGRRRRRVTRRKTYKGGKHRRSHH